MLKLNVLIAGSTGYIGIQLVKLLLNHENVKIKYLCGNLSAGRKISNFDKSLKKYNLPKIVRFKKEFLKNIDVVFTALPNGEAQKISNYLLSKNILIDLAADFRLKNSNDYLKWYNKKHLATKNIIKSIYALPEISKNKIKDFKIISCPGCYPTSILLPLIPLIKKNLINSNDIIIDSKSGYSGAGRGIHKKYKDKNLYNSLSAYGLGFHRHNSEIQQEFDYNTKKKVRFHFTPHLSPMFKGILTTIYVDVKKSANIKTMTKVLKNFYKNDHFIKILKPNTFLSTNDVINTNFCNISICKSKSKDKVIILSTLDNLIKGGAGQAVQNLNNIFKFKYNKGLL